MGMPSTMTKSSRRGRGAPDAAEQRASVIGLGLAVERLRLGAKMSRDAVAKGGGLSSNTILRIEKALQGELGWGTMRRLAQGLNVEVKELVELSQELAPGPAGDRIRQREREARDIDIGAMTAKADEEIEDQQ